MFSLVSDYKHHQDKGDYSNVVESFITTTRKTKANNNSNNKSYTIIAGITPDQ